jgi:hypothetical protein
MDRHDRVPRVIVLVEERPELGFGEVLFENGQGLDDVPLDVFSLRRELQENLNFFLLLLDSRVKLQVAFQALLVLLKRLGFFLVLPDGGGGQAFV